MWAKEVFASCAEETFHPLGRISSEEWAAEEARIQDITDPLVRSTQSANLHQVKELRDKAQQQYMKGGHSWDTAISSAVPLLKAYGVRMIVSSPMIVVHCQHPVDKHKGDLNSFSCAAGVLCYCPQGCQPFHVTQRVGAVRHGAGGPGISAGLFDPRWHPKVITLIQGLSVSVNQANIDYFVSFQSKLHN